MRSTASEVAIKQKVRIIMKLLVEKPCSPLTLHPEGWGSYRPFDPPWIDAYFGETTPSRKTKKADAIKYPAVFGRVGLLVNRPSSYPGVPFI